MILPGRVGAGDDEQVVAVVCERGFEVRTDRNKRSQVEVVCGVAAKPATPERIHHCPSPSRSSTIGRPFLIAARKEPNTDLQTWPSAAPRFGHEVVLSRLARQHVAQQVKR